MQTFRKLPKAKPTIMIKIKVIVFISDHLDVWSIKLQPGQQSLENKKLFRVHPKGEQPIFVVYVFRRSCRVILISSYKRETSLATPVSIV